MTPSIEERILSQMGIEERLGEGPFTRLPPPPRKCSDFVVKELLGLSYTPHPQPSPGMWPLYRIVKEGIDTPTALRRLAAAASRGGWSVSGLKDAQSLSVQWATGPRGWLEAPPRVCFEGGMARLEGWVARRLLRGSHLGNQFLIQARLEAPPEGLSRVFPNYYGPQRFGAQPPFSHEQGLVLLREGVGGLYSLLRERGRGEGWWESRFMVEYESNPQRCEAEPRRCLGRVAGILVEAVQSFLFNKCLSETLRVMRGELRRRPGAWMGVLWGRGTPAGMRGGRVAEVHRGCVARAAGELGLVEERVRRDLLPRGGLRPLSLYVESLRTCAGGGLSMFFRLPPSAYASVFMWENAEGVLGWFTSPCRPSVSWEKAGCGRATRGGL